MYLNYIFANGLEVFIDSLQQVSQVNMREMKTYQPYLSKNTKSMPIHVMPTEYTLSGKLISNILTGKQKIEYIATLDEKVLLCMGSVARAMYGHIVSFNSNHADPVSNTISLQFMPTFPIAQGEVYEAENLHIAGGTTVADEDASGGEAVTLSAYDAYVEIWITQSAYALPLGEYKVFVRAKSTAQIDNDMRLGVWNDTHKILRVNEYRTPAANYSLYETGTFTITSDDVGDTLHIYAKKATSTTNTISIDFIGFVRV